MKQEGAKKRWEYKQRNADCRKKKKKKTPDELHSELSVISAKGKNLSPQMISCNNWDSYY